MSIKNKKTFAIIGKPIEHSLSPTLHNYWLKKYKIDANYSLLHIDEQEIESVTKINCFCIKIFRIIYSTKYR